MVDKKLKMDSSKTDTKSNQQNDIFNYNLDHVYCSDNSNYRNNASNMINNNTNGDLKALRKEHKQLQAMLLLHLDLIQEQSNQIIAKDKQLLQLREENEQLKVRCERAERRSSKGNVCLNSKSSNSPTIDTYFTSNASPNRLDDAVKVKTLASRLSDAEKNNDKEKNNKSSGDKQINSINLKDRQSVAVKRAHDSCNVNIITNNNGKLISKIILQRKQSETGEKIFVKAKTVDDESGRRTNDAKETNVVATTKIKTEAMEVDDKPLSSELNNSIVSIDQNQMKRETSPTISIVNCKKEPDGSMWELSKESRSLKIILEKIPLPKTSPISIVPSITSATAPTSSTTFTASNTISTAVASANPSEVFATSGGSGEKPPTRRHSVRQNYLSTTKAYMTREWQLDEIQAEVNQLITDEPTSTETLEIPKWKTWEFSGNREVPRDIEDVSDDAYHRRHNRFLLDERKRKKWDVQRIREQRTIERLKRRHCKDELNQLKEDNEITSFFPPAENMKVIQLTDEFPVNAFGEVIPALPSTEFHLPWLRSTATTSIGAEPTTAATTSSIRINSSGENSTNVSSMMFISKRRAGRTKSHNSSTFAPAWKINV